MNSASQEEIMANSAQRGTSDFNTEIIQEFRADQGRAGFLAGTPDDSHPPHRRQVWDRVRHAAGLQPQPDGRFAIVAANGGSPTHPD